MNATKSAPGQVMLVGAVVLIFICAATEWTWRLAFQPELGRAWFAQFGWPLYAPPALFWWWFAYEAMSSKSSSNAAVSQGQAGSPP